MIYLATFNYDYDESIATSLDPLKLLRKIMGSFEAELDESHPGLEEEINDIYAAGDWKGFEIYAINPKTGRSQRLSVSRLQQACSKHGKLSLHGKVTKQTSGLPC